MNPQVRTYLIDLARTRDKFAYYSQMVKELNLGYNLETQQGLADLRKVMADVSRYEHHYGRPLLSALLMYKVTNDHGGGFYKLAEDLGIGSEKKLYADQYAFVEMNKCREFWQNEENYRKYAMTDNTTSTTPVTNYLYSRDDLSLFDKWKGEAYDKNDPEHVNAKNAIMESVWDKTVKLGDEILKSFLGFVMDGRRYWSQRGWRKDHDDENVQAAIFKPYTWIKIFRDGDIGKDIFFTFGLDANEEVFAFKIDCQYQRDSKLSQAQIKLCKSLIPQTALWNEISYEELLKTSTEDLTAVCVDFIKRHIQKYDDIIAVVWNGESKPSSFPNELVLRDKPEGDFDEFPEKQREFQGMDIDHEARAKDKKELGTSGEELVKNTEIRSLKENGRLDLAERVRTAKDGEGYDIYSFDEDGNEKFIEVKTTTGGPKTAFYLSHNELCFMRENPAKYYIYRVYNFDGEHKYGDYFILHPGVEDRLLLGPCEYQVLIKK